MILIKDKEKLQIREFQLQLKQLESNSYNLSTQYYQQISQLKIQEEQITSQFLQLMEKLNTKYSCRICTSNFECISDESPCK